MYDFVFDAGTAKMILTSTGETVISQPFKPVNAGSEPWANADEARTWMEENYPQFFATYPEPVPPLEDYPPVEDTSPVEPSNQGEQ